MKFEEQEVYKIAWSKIVVRRGGLPSSVVVVKVLALFCGRFVEKLFVKIRIIENIKCEEITKMQRERERDSEFEQLDAERRNIKD